MDSMHGSITGSSRRPTNWPRPHKREGGTTDGNDAGLHASRSDSKPPAEEQGLRGVSQDGGHLGAPAALRELRARRLLRLVQEQARDETCARNRTSGRQVSRARRELDVLLRRRRDVRGRLNPGTPSPLAGEAPGGALRGERSLGVGRVALDHLTEPDDRVEGRVKSN